MALRKLIAALVVLILLAVIGGVGGLYYIRPDPMLNLDYGSVHVKEKALDMVKNMSLEMEITEEDVNNVLKQSLAKNPQRSKDITVKGARFTLSGDRLIADLSLLWKNKLPAGMQVTYRLSWQSPDLIATVDTVTIKQINLPRDMMDDLSVPIGTELPKPLKIKDVKFGEGRMTLVLQKPSLSDLKDLLA